MKKTIPEKVLAFYKDMPFNYYSSPEIVAEGIKTRNAAEIYLPFLRGGGYSKQQMY